VENQETTNPKIDSDAGVPTETLEETLLRILGAFQIQSPGAFTIAGQVVAVDQAPVLPTAIAGPPLVAALQQQLYANCFIQPFGAPPAQRSMVITPDGDLGSALSQANVGRDRWDPSWYITQVYPNGQIQIWKNGWFRQASPGEYLTNGGPGAPPRVGMSASLFLPRESNTLQPGFYFAFGEVVMDSLDESDGVIRLYWNVQDLGLPALVSLVTSTLNRFQIPFRFKCLNHRALFPRLDASLIYVHRRFFRMVADLMLDVRSKIDRFMMPAVPLFTRAIAPGLAIAEDPGNEPAIASGMHAESFGTHRCRLLAEGMYRAYAAGLRSEGERLGEVMRHFENQGICMHQPHLNPGSMDLYEMPEADR